MAWEVRHDLISRKMHLGLDNRALALELGISPSMVSQKLRGFIHLHAAEEMQLIKFFDSVEKEQNINSEAIKIQSAEDLLQSLGISLQEITPKYKRSQIDFLIQLYTRNKLTSEGLRDAVNALLKGHAEWEQSDSKSENE